MAYTEAVLQVRWQDLPADVQVQAKRCLKDLIATAAGSLALPVSARVEQLVLAQFGTGEVPLWFRGGSSTSVGAAYYNAQTVDSLDCHDGFRPNKGHCGATVVPVAIGAAVGRETTGSELLTAIVMGYEIACRAGLATHALYAPHYHASGTWAALGAAAAAARLTGVPEEDLDSTIGMAEYYAPVAPMLRCTMNPSPVKDAAGPGAWAAAMALAMRQAGMTGLPSLFTAEPTGREQVESLGRDWMILRQYFKPYPTCRWTQPAVEGARSLKREHGFEASDIDRIVVETFDVGASLGRFPPEHSDGAQFCTPWAVAAMLVDGELGVAQVHPDRLRDPAILELGRHVETSVASDIQERFPEECLARVTIRLKDGRTLTAPTMRARGDYVNPLTPAEMDAKFETLVEPALGRGRLTALREVLDSIEDRPADELFELLRWEICAEHPC